MNILLLEQGLPARLITCCLMMVGFGGALVNAESEPRQGVVVLTTGQVHSGLISEVPSGYRVDSKGGYAVFPFYQVRLTAESLATAYETLCDSRKNPTADDHLLLAEWCLKNELLEQARLEVASALKLEPLRSDARTLLRRLDERLGPSPHPELGTQRSAMDAATFQFRNDRSVDGLTRETHQVYVRRVQPLLMNKCGNARCHGNPTPRAEDDGPPERFQFVPVRNSSPSHRQTSERNLSAVLQFIDFDNPGKSPILVTSSSTTDVHGDVFRGATGKDQFRLLENWVRLAAREAAPAGIRPEGRNSHTAEMNAAIPAQEAGSVPELLPIQEGSAENDITVPERVRSLEEERRLLDRIRQEQRPDPFDPDIFNRRVHGGTAHELREEREQGEQRENRPPR